jgi:GTP-binding protein YchF
MSHLSCGIIGLPNVGKSTLFNALTRKATALAANYPFCTIDPNIGVVEISDPRLEVLAKLSKSQKVVPATVTFVDIAGLVKGASQGEGLGNQFLANIRETDALVHIVRCFVNPDVHHVSGEIDPIADIEVVNLELVLADLQTATKRLEKLEKEAKSKRELAGSVTLLREAITHLNKGLPLRTFVYGQDHAPLFSQFLTIKPVLYIANIAENDLSTMTNQYVEQVRAHVKQEGASVISICAQLEEAIGQLTQEEIKEYLLTLGVYETGLDRLAEAAFKLLGLITYITTGEIETRAWTIRKGTSAQEAAGKIHTDLQRGFIRAEIINYPDFIECGSRQRAKELGRARSEGKEYIVQDGDVILFYTARG